MLHLFLLILLRVPFSKPTSEVNVTSHLLIQQEINNLKMVTKTLTDHFEKWNDVFLNSVQPQMMSMVTSLAAVGSNINNLQERAHIWDTLQLHVVAWNDQLATLDRKADIISKGQEKLLEFETKINSVVNIEPKIADALKKIRDIQNAVSNLKEEPLHQDHFLFGEFAARGILSTVKMIEKKIDRLLILQQNSISHKIQDERPKLTIKCNTPRFVEDLLNDISSKVDVIFDKINDKEDNERDFNDYEGEGSGTIEPPLDLQSDVKEVHKRDVEDDVVIKSLTNLMQRISTVENTSRAILNKEIEHLKKTDSVLRQCPLNIADRIEETIDKSFGKQNKILEAFLKHNFPKTFTEHNSDVKIESQKTGCDDLDDTFESGIYIFESTAKYCVLRNNEHWTVIQRRENNPPENFNRSWSDYRTGFGKLSNDFWFGNDFISELSKGRNLVLRVELTDFSGKHVWAEYDTFQILPERSKYQIIIGGYRGNASDSFSSHNGSFFSTFDQKNDQAPSCCPCAVSFGGGWWFNSCFESNLNGLFYRAGEVNGYYGGIIWENWLGNYSLMKTLMMVKSVNKLFYQTSTLWPYYEDP